MKREKCSHITSFLEALQKLEKDHRVNILPEGYDNPYLQYSCEECQSFWDDEDDEETEDFPLPPLSAEPKCKAQIAFGCEFVDLKSWDAGTTLRDILTPELQLNLGMDPEVPELFEIKKTDPPTGFMGSYLKNPVGATLKKIPVSLDEEIEEGRQYRIIRRSLGG